MGGNEELRLEYVECYCLRRSTDGYGLSLGSDVAPVPRLDRPGKALNRSGILRMS